MVYPKQHDKLREAIIKHGAIITEYPPSTTPRGFNFPTRNRIISGLSQGTVVVDANENSGSLITARTAILQGREIYAVPSNIDSENSSGTNMLIRDGAQAVLCGYDVVGNYTYMFGKKLNISQLKQAEERSDFDPQALSSLGIRARGVSPALFEGESAKAEKGRNVACKKTTKVETGAMKAPKQTKTENSLDVLCNDRANGTEPGDSSRAVLESLKDVHRRVFEEMPLDRAVSVDHLMNVGFKLGEVISALTMLEIKGLILSLPGGLYIRK